MKIISKITLPTKFEGLQMSFFDLNQTCETGCIENCEIWIFSGTCLLYYCIKSFKRVLMLYKKIKVLWFKKTRTSCKERFFYTDNPGKNYWKKFKKSSKIEQKQIKLIFATTKFVAAMTKILFMEGRLGTRFCLRAVLIFPKYILFF